MKLEQPLHYWSYIILNESYTRFRWRPLQLIPVDWNSVRKLHWKKSNGLYYSGYWNIDCVCRPCLSVRAVSSWITKTTCMLTRYIGHISDRTYTSPLWPGYTLATIWPRRRTWSTLLLILACWLAATSHYINQCWLIINGILWHSPECNFTGSALDRFPWYEFYEKLREITPSVISMTYNCVKYQ